MLELASANSETINISGSRILIMMSLELSVHMRIMANAKSKGKIWVVLTLDYITLVLRVFVLKSTLVASQKKEAIHMHAEPQFLCGTVPSLSLPTLSLVHVHPIKPATLAQGESKFIYMIYH